MVSARSKTSAPTSETHTQHIQFNTTSFPLKVTLKKQVTPTMPSLTLAPHGHRNVNVDPHFAANREKVHQWAASAVHFDAGPHSPGVVFVHFILILHPRVSVHKELQEGEDGDEGEGNEGHWREEQSEHQHRGSTGFWPESV